MDNLKIAFFFFYKWNLYKNIFKKSTTWPLPCYQCTFFLLLDDETSSKLYWYQQSDIFNCSVIHTRNWCIQMSISCIFTFILLFLFHPVKQLVEVFVQFIFVLIVKTLKVVRICVKTFCILWNTTNYIQIKLGVLDLPGFFLEMLKFGPVNKNSNSSAWNFKKLFPSFCLQKAFIFKKINLVL